MNTTGVLCLDQSQFDESGQMAESDMLPQKNWVWLMRKSVIDESGDFHLSNETSKIPLSSLGRWKSSIAPPTHLNCKNTQDFPKKKINGISIKKCILKM